MISVVGARLEQLHSSASSCPSLSLSVAARTCLVRGYCRTEPMMFRFHTVDLLVERKTSLTVLLARAHIKS